MIFWEHNALYPGGHFPSSSVLMLWIYLLLSRLCHLKYYGQVEWPLALDCKHSALRRVGSLFQHLKTQLKNVIKRTQQMEGNQSKWRSNAVKELHIFLSLVSNLAPFFKNDCLRLQKCNLNHIPLLYFKVVMIAKFLNHAQTFDPAYACIDASYITTQLTNLARMHLAKSLVLPIKRKEIIKP